MHRLILTALALSALLASAACAGPSKDGKQATCALGKGTPVCCKTFVKDHCINVPCCEVGNAAFFTTTECGTCLASMKERAAAHCGETCDTKAASECGNAGFFSSTGSCASKSECSAKK
jgi:hypothetical protein